MTSLPRLYAIADAAFGNPIVLARELFDGGARLVQVRNKNASAREVFDQVVAILKIAPTDSRIIVNDRPDIALVSGAGGVHLGQTDLSPRDVRKLLSENQILGYSTHNSSQARDSELLPVDYIAAGPVFPTSTKTDADTVIGLDGLREICSRASRPVVAIGGITMANVKEVFACGAASVAVISDLLKSKDVARRT
ncbi:MAG TPA: thiamine phosphate synthase, partial [Terriglobia bacterium]|nr:thiamine phosphate synthase [Terriglobia bacterium]